MISFHLKINYKWIYLRHLLKAVSVSDVEGIQTMSEFKEWEGEVRAGRVECNILHYTS